MALVSVYSQSKFCEVPALPANTLKLFNKSSHMVQVVFKLLPLCWDLDLHEFVHKPCKSRVLISHSSLALLDILSIGFQS